jgi:hypothetical protein
MQRGESKWLCTINKALNWINWVQFKSSHDLSVAPFNYAFKSKLLWMLKLSLIQHMIVGLFNWMVKYMMFKQSKFFMFDVKVVDVRCSILVSWQLDLLRILKPKTIYKISIYYESFPFSPVWSHGNKMNWDQTLSTKDNFREWFVIFLVYYKDLTIIFYTTCSDL